MAHDFMHMTAKQALVLAKDASGLTNAQIANRTAIGPEAVQRYFSEFDDYFPAIKHVPALCRALGNTIIFDWLRAQMADMLPSEDPMDSVAAVAQTAVTLGALAGNVCAEASEAMADGIIEAHEARALNARLADLAEHVKIAQSRLQPVIIGHASAPSQVKKGAA